jgi:hypothetical protein
MNKKRLCILQVTPSSPNPEHVNMFSEKENCDFFFVTHDEPHKDALDFCPNTTWTDTRNILATKVPKNYEYYAFVDYDYNFRPLCDLEPLEQILEDLSKFEPAVLTYYPGKGMITPFAENTAYRDSKEASILPFSHCGMKVVHHSLMSWFFPMIVRFGGGVEACHLFNILEIPFLRHVVCSHKMVYDNGNTDEEAPHNQDGAWNKYRMDEMWKWIKPAFKKSKIIDSHAINEGQKLDSLLPKKAFIDIVLRNNVQPIAAEKKDNYLDLNSISKFFDLNHERFSNINVNLEIQAEPHSNDTLKAINEVLSNLTFESLHVTDDPWPSICNLVNSKIRDERKITINECVEIYQNLNTNALFKNSCKFDQKMADYLQDKKVAFVGPSPYLVGLNRGKLIDSYDVVVRIQSDILSVEDYGSRIDVIQSCLNSNYGPPVVKYVSENPLDKPKFIICNDTVSRLNSAGQWVYVTEDYLEVFANLGVELLHLQRGDLTWDRWNLYWEIYPRRHTENFGINNYTWHTANFNSGYGALNYLLRYPVKELAVFGVDFYNCAIPQTNEQKYNKEYIRIYGDESRHLGPSRQLHDQLSQMIHCRNVLMKDSRFNLDSDVAKKLLSDDVSERLEKFKLLPKFEKETR